MRTARLVALSLLLGYTCVVAAESPLDVLRTEAAAAEAAGDRRRALESYLRAYELDPSDATLAQKVAQQYSDLVPSLPTKQERREYAGLALEYAVRAAELDPQSPVNVLSVAISRGTLAVYSDVRTRVELARAIKEDAQRALDLDPEYDWAHHVLGRWQYEVATLGTAARWIVGIVYGGLPRASVADGVRHLERAVELAPETLAHHVELGLAYRAAGRVEDARRALERGLELPSRLPHDDAARQRARDALERLAG
jgi:tetratricopeptide (TPR) repeat protein